MRKIYSIICVLLLLVAACSKKESAINPSGTGGSLARFTIAEGRLYVVDNSNLHIYTLQNPSKPVLVKTISLNNDRIETIFPWRNKLFIGSQTAMYIYSIEKPDDPVLEGSASHVRACDPVVANDDFAYVTVRTGSTCQGTINALLVYDVKASVTNPREVANITLTAPHGLGLSGNILYVTDGAAGLVVYDVTDGAKPKEIARITGYTFFDCIPLNGILVTMIEGGMAIYDANDPGKLKLLSEIKN